MTRGIFGIVLVVSLAGASLLIIFTSKKAFIVSFTTGLLATVVLSAVSHWPTPSMLPPSLGDRDRLARLWNPVRVRVGYLVVKTHRPFQAGPGEFSRKCAMRLRYSL